MHIIPHLLFVILALAAAPDTAAQDGLIDIKTSEGYVQARRKMHCSMENGKPIVFHWAGSAYSRVPGEKDRLIFQVEGMTTRRCATVQDPKRGVGYRIVAREMMLYKDPKSGAVLRSWQNPWTDKTVEVIHVANDPLNGGPIYGLDEEGNVPPLDLVIQDENFFYSAEFALFYANPLGGDYQEYIGGHYHVNVMYNTFGNLEELLDPTSKNVMTNTFWVRMAGWLPWMEMGSRPGMMYFTGVVTKMKSFDALPQALKREIRTNYPAWQEPPPIDDKRPNESSWTYFKKIVDARRAKEKQKSK